MVEYRPIPEDRMDEFRSFITYAFSLEEGPFDPDEADEPPAAASIGESRGLFEGDELQSVCRHYWFDANLRGDVHPIAGLSAVATPPEFRRRGLVRRMLAESLAEYRDRDQVLSVLWPFEHPFYRQFGWEIANQYASVECRPDVLSFARPESSGHWERMEPDDWRELGDVLAVHGADFELSVDRSEDWWRKRVFESWSVDPYVYGWRDDAGDLRAYVVYTVTEDDDKQLRVWDQAWTDHEARCNLYRFLADHDSQVGEVRLYGPRDTSLLDLVDDPGDLTLEVNAGPMVRAVDVPALLESIAYPTDATGTLALCVVDDLAEWNDGTVAVTLDDGHATVEETDAAPDLTLGVGALSQAVVGYRSPETLAAQDDLAVEDDAALRLLETALPSRPVFLREGF